MRINHNIASLNTYRQLTNNTVSTSKALEKLSSGLRINRAGDDAAGLAISEKMRGQIRGLEMASKNAQDGISLIQTAEGALNETHSILQRMRELAVQAANDTNNVSDRTKLQAEIDQLAKEITRISNTTEFNNRNLLNGGVTIGVQGEVSFHIGANADQNLSLSIGAMDAASLGVSRNGVTLTITSGVGASNPIATTTSTASGAYAITAATVAATAAQVTDTSVVGTTQAVGSGHISITHNGVVQTVDFVSGDTLNSVVTALNALSGVVARLSGAGSDVLVIESSGTGSNQSIQISNYSGSATFALAAGAADTGTDASLNVTLSGATNETVSVANNATSVSFANGISFTKSSAVTTTLAGTITATQVASTGATFSGTVKTADAIAFGGIDISTQSGANLAINTLHAAVETVSNERSKLGAFQNRLEHTINNLGTTSENLTASESRIRDVDMAKEMMEFTKNNILTQAAQAMLAQANQQPQGVLQLLR